MLFCSAIYGETSNKSNQIFFCRICKDLKDFCHDRSSLGTIGNLSPHWETFQPYRSKSFRTFFVLCGWTALWPQRGRRSITGVCEAPPERGRKGIDPEGVAHQCLLGHSFRVRSAMFFPSAGPSDTAVTERRRFQRHFNRTVRPFFKHPNNLSKIESDGCLSKACKKGVRHIII